MDSEKYEPFHNKSISIIYIKKGIQIEEILEILEGKKPAKLWRLKFLNDFSLKRILSISNIQFERDF